MSVDKHETQKTNHLLETILANMPTAVAESPVPPAGLVAAQFRPKAGGHVLTKTRDVQTALNYLPKSADETTVEPVYYNRPETFDNIPREEATVTIRDVAGSESEYTLDKQGFRFGKHLATEKEFADDEQIRASYYPEIEQLLKDW